MPAPYSIDLREKAVSAVERGEKKSQVCRTLNISRNTLDLWIKKKKQTGNVSPVTGYHRGPQPKINDLNKFKEFAEENGHLTQREMAEKWPEPLSKTRIGQALKKIDFTRKKNLYLQGNR
jgi:transposase